MAIDISKIVTTKFDVVKSASSIGSYNHVLFVMAKTDPSARWNNAQAIYNHFANTTTSTEDPWIIDLTLTVDEITDDNAEQIAAQILTEKKKVSGTENDFIFVCFDSILSTQVNHTLLTAIEKFEAPNRVCVCISIEKNDTLKTGDINTICVFPNHDDVINRHAVAIKLYPTGSTNKEVCLSIPAYFSNINLNYNNAIKDYAFTEESYSIANVIMKTDWISTDNYEKLVNCTNFVDVVGKQQVNFGGNLAKDNISISAYFASIAAENDVTQAVLSCMLKKQYLTDGGLNNVVACINKALQRYIINGYLQSKVTWQGGDYILTHGKFSRTVIKRGDYLPEGYYIAKVPMSFMTAEDRNAHKFTPIRVFMQTAAGARIVDIEGQIID